MLGLNVGIVFIKNVYNIVINVKYVEPIPNSLNYIYINSELKNIPLKLTPSKLRLPIAGDND